MPRYLAEQIEPGLVRLHHAASRLGGWRKDQNEKFIDVGEYALALDGVAYAYLDNNEPMPADLFEIFESLAVEMDMERDPEYAAVAELRARMKARPPPGQAPT